VLSVASLVGCALGAYVSDAIGRRLSIIGASLVTIVGGYVYARFDASSDPAIVLSVGFVLIVAIYVQTAILFGVYTPELFPTEVRLRANGICNTLGRGATVVSPFIVGSLMASYKLPGVVLLMIALGAGSDRGGVGPGASSRAIAGSRTSRRKLDLVRKRFSYATITCDGKRARHGSTSRQGYGQCRAIRQGRALFCFIRCCRIARASMPSVRNYRKSFRVIVPELPGFGRSHEVKGGLAEVADRMRKR